MATWTPSWTTWSPVTNSAPTRPSSSCTGGATATAATCCCRRRARRPLHELSALSPWRVSASQESRGSTQHSSLGCLPVRTPHTPAAQWMVLHRPLTARSCSLVQQGEVVDRPQWLPRSADYSWAHGSPMESAALQPCCGATGDHRWARCRDRAVDAQHGGLWPHPAACASYTMARWAQRAGGLTWSAAVDALLHGKRAHHCTRVGCCVATLGSLKCCELTL